MPTNFLVESTKEHKCSSCKQSIEPGSKIIKTRKGTWYPSDNEMYMAYFHLDCWKGQQKNKEN